MREALLSLVQCPACGGDLRIGTSREGSPGWIEHGEIVCSCDRHPVCWGILVLKRGHLKRRLLDLQRKGKFREAAVLALGAYGEELCRIDAYLDAVPAGAMLRTLFSGPILPYHAARYGKFVNGREPFWGLAGRGPYADYLRHRFSAQSFWLLYPFLPALKRQGRRLLELCCGAGHASFVVSRYASPEDLVCLDGNFRNLFLARRFSSGADLVLADAGGPLPFRDGAFTCILMMDALHYVASQLLLARESERVLAEDGASFFLHVHNRGGENPSAGHPLGPADIRRLFRRPVALVPDRHILEDFLFHDRLDLTRGVAAETLERCDAFSVASGNAMPVWEGIWKEVLQAQERLAINPLYRVREAKGRLRLERRFPSPAYAREYPLSEAFLPPVVEMDRSVRDRMAGGAADDEIHGLRRRFVVLDVPQGYLPSS